MAEKFGIGEKTSLDFPMEKTGILPDEADIPGAGMGISLLDRAGFWLLNASE